MRKSIFCLGSAILATDYTELKRSHCMTSIQTTNPTKIVSWILTATALFLILQLHLLSALLAGLLVHELVNLTSPLLFKRLTGKRSRLFAVATLAVITITALIVLVFLTIAFFKNDAGNARNFEPTIQAILNDAQTRLPSWITDDLPTNTEDLKNLGAEWLNAHSHDVRAVGKSASHLVVRLLIGMVIGALVSLHEMRNQHELPTFTAELSHRISRFTAAFRQIVFSQIRISLMNTLFTAIFLLVIFPVFQVHLPLVKTLIAVTFFAGLLPVIGNLISNTVIVIAALSISIHAAIGALIFLIVIHKLEYFLNARIIGSRIRAHAWELLIAMAVMEAAFGIGGLIAAPIYYAYIKNELSDANLI
jgi:predicted PurR-regulated permease PerM